MHTVLPHYSTYGRILDQIFGLKILFNVSIEVIELRAELTLNTKKKTVLCIFFQGKKVPLFVQTFDKV